MDSWTDKQIKALEVGGNENMKSFFERKGIPSSLTIREKYHTEQATAYRKRIKALVEGTPVPSDDDVPKYVPSKRHSNNGARKDRGDYVGMSRSQQQSAEAAARERMRQKFKSGGLSGVGSGGYRGGRGNGSSSSSSNDWLERSSKAVHQTVGTVFQAASRQTEKLKQRDWSSDHRAVKSEVKKGVSWLSSGVSNLWKSAARAISDDSNNSNEPIHFYRHDGGIPRSSGFGKGISSDDSSFRKTGSLVQQEQRERRRSRSYSPKKNMMNNNDWDDDWGDDDDDDDVDKLKKKKNGSLNVDSKQMRTAARLPTSEYDPFGLEKDFLGEIDAVLNSQSDEDEVRSKSTTTTTTKEVPPLLPTPTKPQSKEKKSKEKPKPKTLSGDDFFSSFGV
jgi:hypothetical protein